MTKLGQAKIPSNFPLYHKRIKCKDSDQMCPTYQIQYNFAIRMGLEKVFVFEVAA